MKFPTVLLIAMLLFALSFNFGCQNVDSQTTNEKNTNITNPTDEKWTKENILLSDIMDRIERELENKESEWKTESKVVRKPPEYSTQHSYARLIGKSKGKSARIEINLSDSSIDWYHQGVATIARGSVKQLPSIGDEAISIKDYYDPSGQVRFIKKNYYVVIYANRPKYAEEIAKMVEKQINEVEITPR